METNIHVKSTMKEEQDYEEPDPESTALPHLDSQVEEALQQPNICENGDMKEMQTKSESVLEERKRRVRKRTVKNVKAEPVDSTTTNTLLLFETEVGDINDAKTTLDFFDDNLGTLKNRGDPTPTEFACSLLREVLLALTEPSVLREKVKLGALLLHLSTATQEFDWLYQYYQQV